MDALRTILDALGDLIWELLKLLWSAITAVTGALKAAIVAYPSFGALLAAAAAAALAYWFADGVRNWRRKCLTCGGKGAFDSKISSHLNRPCPSCDGSPAGGGRHVTLRKRLWDRLRGRKQ